MIDLLALLLNQDLNLTKILKRLRAAEFGLQQVYYGQELSPEELIIRELLENFDVSIGEPNILSAFNGLADLYETLIGIQEPKALFTCKDCLVELD